MQKIKIYSVYTDELRLVKDVFLASIKDEWDLHIEYFGKAGEGDGDRHSKGWYSIQKRKIQFIREKIKENLGNVIIWSDVDIQFFSKGRELIERAIAGKDVVYQAEHWSGKEVNIGFAAIRCNEKTLALYDTVLQYDIENLPIADQSAINDILSKKLINIEWDILPNQFWAMSHYICNQEMPPGDVILHHANCTIPKTINGRKIGSVELKLQQFQLVREYVLAGKEEELIK